MRIRELAVSLEVTFNSIKDIPHISKVSINPMCACAFNSIKDILRKSNFKIRNSGSTFQFY